jgi:hypothetical protein
MKCLVVELRGKYLQKDQADIVGKMLVVEVEAEM